MISDNGRNFVTLDGREFPYDRTSKESRRKAAEAAHAHNAEVIRQREAQAGRPLSLKELIHGIEHSDDRSLAERIADANPVQPASDPPSCAEAVEKHLAYLRENPGHTPDELGRNRRAIAYYEAIAKKERAKAAAKAQAEERAKTLESPKVQDALKHANSVLNGMRFDPTVQQADVERAEKRLATLKATADARAYWERAQPWIKARDEKIHAAVNNLKQQAATLADRAAELQRTQQIPPDVAAEIAAGESNQQSET